MPISKQKKIEVVGQMKAKLKQSKVVAIASVQNLPTKHYDSIRKKIRGKAEIFLTRQTLVERAITEGRPELKELIPLMKGSCAIIFSEISAFKLAKLLRESKSKTFAKAGQIAPSDIVIPAGETNLPPGPVLTELKQAKIEAKIQGPKVVIAKDATVAKKGEPISDAVAKILTKLSIEPMEVGMKMRAAYEDGLIYGEDVLDIDDKFWMDQLLLAHRQALNLAVSREIYNRYSTELIIQKAAREANALNKMIEAKAGAPAAKADEAPAEENAGKESPDASADAPKPEAEAPKAEGEAPKAETAPNA
ncbi:MAG: 50S ribosomal protein L10 [Candidatus Micrarchaeota archaeon]